MIDLDLQARTDEQRPYAEHDRDREAFWVHLTEAQAEALASGYVPLGTKSVLRELLDYDLEDQRRADRPIEKVKKARR